MKRTCVIAIVTLTLTIGCAAIKYRPYDPDAPLRGGYSEHKLASDIYEVRYRPQQLAPS